MAPSGPSSGVSAGAGQGLGELGGGAAISVARFGQGGPAAAGRDRTRSAAMARAFAGRYVVDDGRRVLAPWACSIGGQAESSGWRCLKRRVDR